MAKKRKSELVPELSFTCFFFGDGARTWTRAYQCIEEPRLELRVHQLKEDGTIFRQVFIDHDLPSYPTTRSAYRALVRRQKDDSTITS